MNVNMDMVNAIDLMRLISNDSWPNIKNKDQMKRSSIILEKGGISPITL